MMFVLRIYILQCVCVKEDKVFKTCHALEADSGEVWGVPYFLEKLS